MQGTIEIIGGGPEGATHGYARYWDIQWNDPQPTASRVYNALELRKSRPGEPSSREVWDVQLVSETKGRATFALYRR